MATSNGPWQNHARVEWVYSISYPTNSTAQVTVEAWLRLDSSAYMNNIAGSKSWSGQWGSGSSSVRWTISYGARVKFVTSTHTVTRGSSAKTLSYTATANHTFGSTTSTLRPTVKAATPSTPGAPSQLIVERTSDTRHLIRWNRNATYTKVQVQRRQNTGSGWSGWSTVGTPTGNAANYTDSGTVANRAYQWRARGYNAGGWSSYSSATSTTYTTPAAPSGLKAARVGDTIRIDATTKPPYATSYDIQDNGSTIATSVSLPWVHSAPSQVITHTYRARAKRGSLVSGYSSNSNTVQLSAPPTAPTLLGPSGSLEVTGEAERVFSWLHNPVDSSEQVAANLRYRLQGGAWVDLSTTTEESIAVTQDWEAGVYEWQVQTRGVHPTFSPWSALSSFTLIDAPGISIQTPSTGEWNSSRVGVTWLWYQEQGRPQSSWEAQLIDEDAPVGEGLIEELSGTGATPFANFSSALTDQGNYTIRVRAATGNIWSEWDEESIWIRLYVPDPPEVISEWDEASGAVQLQICPPTERPGVAQPVTNLITNPSFEAEVSGNILVWRNTLSPNANNGVWTAVPNQVTLEASDALVDERFESGVAREYVCMSTEHEASSYFYIRVGNSWTNSVAVSVGTTYLLAVRVALSEGFHGDLSLILHTSNSEFSSIGGTREVDNGDGTITLWTVVECTAIVPFLTTHSVRLIVTNPEAGDRIRASDGLVMSWSTSAVDTPPFFYFSGTFSPDPDLDPGYIGSTACLFGRPVPGVVVSNGIRAIQSSRWSKYGEKSIRIIKNSSDPSNPNVSFDLPAEAIAGGTALVTRYQNDPLPVEDPSLLDTMLRVSTPSQAVGGENVAGEQELRLEFDPITHSGQIVLYLCSDAIGAECWYDGLGVFEGSYDGDYFDGDSPDIEINGDRLDPAWSGEPHASTSVASLAVIPDIASIEVERSVYPIGEFDDPATTIPPETWELVSISEASGECQNLADYESLSCGTTYYRITGYSAEGSGAETYVAADADSQALWLGTGTAYDMTARLPFDPEIDVTRGRTRSSEAYEGRTLPVGYASAQKSISVSVKGTIFDEEGEGDETGRSLAASLSELEEVIEAHYPTHLYRDMHGRRIYGIVNEMQNGRMGQIGHACSGDQCKNGVHSYSFTVDGTEAGNGV